MLSTKDSVPAGGLAQLIAGEVPSPGAAPSAAWLNFTGISPPSGNAGIVNVMAGPLAAGAPPRCPPAMGIEPRKMIVETRHNRPARILFLLIPDCSKDNAVVTSFNILWPPSSRFRKPDESLLRRL